MNLGGSNGATVFLKLSLLHLGEDRRYTILNLNCFRASKYPLRHPGNQHVPPHPAHLDARRGCRSVHAEETALVLPLTAKTQTTKREKRLTCFGGHVLSSTSTRAFSRAPAAFQQLRPSARLPGPLRCGTGRWAVRHRAIGVTKAVTHVVSNHGSVRKLLPQIVHGTRLCHNDAWLGEDRPCQAGQAPLRTCARDSTHQLRPRTSCTAATACTAKPVPHWDGRYLFSYDQIKPYSFGKG